VEAGSAILNRMVNTKPLCGCLHHSQEFGNTAPMAEAVAEGLREAGVEIDLLNTNVCTLSCIVKRTRR
jgi:flavorubredoxin